MAEYNVTWTIDIDADSPAEAAQIARNIQQDVGNEATFFTVVDEAGTTHTIELDATVEE